MIKVSYAETLPFSLKKHRRCQILGDDGNRLDVKRDMLLQFMKMPILTVDGLRLIFAVII